jgi:hypothetical protein
MVGHLIILLFSCIKSLLKHGSRKLPPLVTLEEVIHLKLDSLGMTNLLEEHSL